MFFQIAELILLNSWPHFFQVVDLKLFLKLIIIFFPNFLPHFKNHWPYFCITPWPFFHYPWPSSSKWIVYFLNSWSWFFILPDLIFWNYWSQIFIKFLTSIIIIFCCWPQILHLFLTIIFSKLLTSFSK